MLSKVKTIFILYINNNNCICIKQILHTWLTGFKADTVTDVTTANDPPPLNFNLTEKHLKKKKGPADPRGL